MGWNPVKSIQSAWHSATTAVSNAGSWVGSNIQNISNSVRANLDPSAIGNAVKENLSKIDFSKLAESVAKNIPSSSGVLENVAKNVGNAVQSVTSSTGSALQSVGAGISSGVGSAVNSEFTQKALAITVNAGVKALPTLGKIAISAGEGALAGALAGGSAGTVVPVLGNLVGLIGGAGAGAVSMGVKEIVSSGLPTLKSIWEDSLAISSADLSGGDDDVAQQLQIEEQRKRDEEEYQRLYQEEYDRQYKIALENALSEEEARKRAEAESSAIVSRQSENDKIKLILLLSAGYFLLRGKK